MKTCSRVGVLVEIQMLFTKYLSERKMFRTIVVEENETRFTTVGVFRSNKF
jgi:hypothetical protein